MRRRNRGKQGRRKGLGSFKVQPRVLVYVPREVANVVCWWFCSRRTVRRNWKRKYKDEEREEKKEKQKNKTERKKGAQEKGKKNSLFRDVIFVLELGQEKKIQYLSESGTAAIWNGEILNGKQIFVFSLKSHRTCVKILLKAVKFLMKK